MVATVEEALRVIADRPVMMEAARLAWRTVAEIEECRTVCDRAYRAFADDYPGMEDSFRVAVAKVREAEVPMRDAAVRLRYLGG
ncbi:hypothetical protein LCD36_28250 [Saccharopolyspora sp. 6T]|uniref:hypothetical protein n=1 Tax=Saccharopolyspora sp. 6T TaxID=2877238 RepID=UPI001CD6C830|nr:hypothetical protein [Saccharopolyspora sp. 6T]MCA1190313.1 hypothetical protein [Saccharopolyspora sp. 6T]